MHTKIFGINKIYFKLHLFIRDDIHCILYLLRGSAILFILSDFLHNQYLSSWKDVANLLFFKVNGYPIFIVNF